MTPDLGDEPGTSLKNYMQWDSAQRTGTHTLLVTYWIHGLISLVLSSKD